MAYRRYSRYLRRRRIYRRPMRRSVRPARRPSFRRAAKRSRQDAYRRTFYSRSTVQLPDNGTTMAFPRVEVALTDFDGLTALAGQFQKYKFARYFVVWRPATQMDAAQFAVQTANSSSFTYYDPFNRNATVGFSDLGNLTYAKRSSPRRVQRKGMPVVVRTDTNAGAFYDVTRSPWIETSSTDVLHYCTNAALAPAPPINGNQIVMVQEVYATVYFAGRKTV